MLTRPLCLAEHLDGFAARMAESWPAPTDEIDGE
jgi:hypothetical protein